MRALLIDELDCVVGGQNSGIPPGFTAVDDGKHYMQDAEGRYHLTPSYEAHIRDAQANGWGIDWGGVANDLISISAGSIGGAGGRGFNFLGGWLADRAQNVRELQDALNDALRRRRKDPDSNVVEEAQDEGR